jgi:hypothetical protein
MRVEVRRSHQRRGAPSQGKLVASPTHLISTRPSCAESLKSLPTMTTRRGLLLGLGVIIAAPAIVGHSVFRNSRGRTCRAVPDRTRR